MADEGGEEMTTAEVSAGASSAFTEKISASGAPESTSETGVDKLWASR